MEFYQVFIKYCNKKGVAPTRAALDIGLTKPTATRWANGSIPSDANIAKLADYFEVDLDQFKEEIGAKKDVPTVSDEDEVMNEIIEIMRTKSKDQQEAFLQLLRSNF